MALYLFEIPKELSFDDIKEYLDHVSEERKEKILRYKPESSRIESLLAALLIRYAIRKDLSLPNNAIAISHNEYGKPYLTGYPDYHFSVSHSGRYIAFISDNAPVGIDIQNMEQLKKPISGHFFTDYENSYISENGLNGFYEVWTRKEAYVKLLGTGFSTPISSFDVFDKLGVSFNTQENESYMITVCSRNVMAEKVEFERVGMDELEPK